MDVLRAANRRQAESGNVLHLELGQPSTGAPAGVLAAARRALETDPIGYTEAFGLFALRERIAASYEAAQGIAPDPERVVITTGSSGGFVLAFLAAFDPGDRVALADPGYPGYRNILQALGIEPVTVPCGPDTRFQPTPELLEALDEPVDGLIVASPSNPAGTMLTEEALGALASYCRDRGIRLISDEIYHGITYAAPGASALRFTEDAVVINSFSKYYSMTGWRIGWMVVPPDLLRSTECLAQNFYISAPTLSQHAAVAAFDCIAELDANVARYARNRALLLAGLPKCGIDRTAPPDGAFYLYADIAHLTNDSEAFCRRMMEETGVTTAPGVDFDRGRGHTWMRLSFSGATDTIAEAVSRLQAWLPKA
ncbi:MAG: aminotransferase class I/II-fold pyridoxal phosphate-dependent enzyme [Alphaproteobacteria bacterium]|nr:aminotransferase class I/II-fold pyridoxal phosphate-dependent enzyme [Alphaproteobacteria bacterium]